MARIDLPSSVSIIRRVEWTLDRPAQVNRSGYTGVRQVVANPWHGAWRARVELKPIVGEANVRAWRAFIGKLKGQINTFRLPATERAQNSNSGVTVGVTAVAGATSLTIAGASEDLLAGQLVTVNGQLLQLTLDQSGTLLHFEPPLRQQATVGTTVVTSRPYALVSLVDSAAGWNVDAGQQYGISFDVEEAILEADGAPPESAADVPFLSSPFAAATGFSTADLEVETDDGTGTLYWVVTTSPTTPTAVQIMAGQDAAGAAAAASGSQPVSGAGLQEGDATGLTGSTTYYAHFAQENAMLGVSVAVTSPSFATSAGLAAPTSTFTMTQLPVTRVYQRSTTTGGGQGKGQGTIPVTISSASAGTINARCRSSDGSTILQAEWAAATIANGATVANIAGVDARLGSFYLDLKDSSGSWKLGTRLVHMGRIIQFGGQSLATRFVRAVSDSGTTIASVGVSIDSNGLVYAQGDAQPGGGTPFWALPTDGSDLSNYNSAFAPEFLRLQIAAAGVSCALIGMAMGSTSITYHIGAGGGVTARNAILSAVGGFEAALWLQGHSDSLAGMSNATYQTNLSTYFTEIAAQNAVRGSSFDKFVATIPNVNNGWGSIKRVRAIRSAGRTWSAANGAVSVEMSNINTADGVHENQLGAIQIARHFHRATRPSLGLSTNDYPPAITSGSRSSGSADIVLSVPGAGLITQVGTAGNRFSVSDRGGFAQRPIASITPGTNTLTITLAEVPANRAALDVSFDDINQPVADGSANMLLDANTDGDGITHGRPWRPTYASPIQIANPGTNAAPNLTGLNTPTFAASGKSGFSQCLTGGYGKGANGLGDDVFPYSDIFTFEAWIKFPSVPTGTTCLFGLHTSNGQMYFYTNTGKKMNLATGPDGFAGTTDIATDGAWHYVQLIADGEFITIAVDGVAETPIAGRVNPRSTGGNGFTLGTYFSSGFQWTGYIMEASIWNIARAAQVQSAPLVGNEAGLYSLYHLNGNLNAG